MKKLVRKIEKIVNTPEGVEADGYRVSVNVPDGELRLVLCDKAGKAISQYTCEAQEGYTLAQKILRGYDKLEGI